MGQSKKFSEKSQLSCPTSLNWINDFSGNCGCICAPLIGCIFKLIPPRHFDDAPFASKLLSINDRSIFQTEFQSLDSRYKREKGQLLIYNFIISQWLLWLQAAVDRIVSLFFLISALSKLTNCWYRIHKINDCVSFRYTKSWKYYFE